MTQTLTLTDGSSMHETYVDVNGLLSITQTKISQIMASQMKQVMNSIECVWSELVDESDQISQTKT